MAKISDLTAGQLARHAYNVGAVLGRQTIGTRLIYHALRLDRYEPVALRCLSDFLATPGTEAFSAIVLEFGLAPDSPLSAEARHGLDEVRFMRQWSWGFSKHKSGEQELTGDKFADRSQFELDEARYASFITGLINHAGSLERAFSAGHLLCGAAAGILLHQDYGHQAPIEEVFFPERFRDDAEYAEWLQSDTEELDELEEERQQHMPE